MVSALRVAVADVRAITPKTAAAITTMVTISSTNVVPRQRAGDDMTVRSGYRDEAAQRINLKGKRLRRARWRADYGDAWIRDGCRAGNRAIRLEKEDDRSEERRVG